MYHGEVVPGFPQHPHRGFETVTIVRRGLIDHSDSLGAAARFGGGDVQWLTAGKGIVHAEMFPLLERERDNPLELFQIWLNLPAADKLAEPHFSMLWNEAIPRHVARDAEGRATEVAVVAGRLGDGLRARRRRPGPGPRAPTATSPSGPSAWSRAPASPCPPPAAGPTAPSTSSGASARCTWRASRSLAARQRSELRRRPAGAAARATDRTSELLLLQGRPIGEPVAQYGPFVMNTRAEIQQAMIDYQRTQFGGWPWPSDDPVHPREEGRFARHASGRIERPG